MLPPLFDEDSSFGTISEPFEVQTFVSDRERFPRVFVDEGQALQLLPFAQASNTKSYAHTWLTPVAGVGRGRPLAARFLLLRRGT